MQDCNRQLDETSCNARPDHTLDHVWTAPAVQEESDYQRSVRVQSCIRPLKAAVLTYKLFNANTVTFTRIKSGRQVQTGSIEVSSDGKTLTVTTKGVDSKGQQINNVAVYDRQ
jgi:hypothetical protein